MDAGFILAPFTGEVKLLHPSQSISESGVITPLPVNFSSKSTAMPSRRRHVIKNLVITIVMPSLARIKHDWRGAGCAKCSKSFPRRIERVTVQDTLSRARSNHVIVCCAPFCLEFSYWAVNHESPSFAANIIIEYCRESMGVLSASPLWSFCSSAAFPISWVLANW